MQLIQDMQDLLQEMEAAQEKNICPFIPRMRALVGRLTRSMPEAYQAFKPQFDEYERVSATACSPTGNASITSPAAPIRPDAVAETNTPEEPRSQGSADVRMTQQVTRSLTDDESSTLRKGLHYSPPRATVRLNGSGRTVLQDDRGRSLAAITVQWLKTERPLLRSTRPGSPPAYGVPIGYFRLKLENFSNCLFDSKATLVIPGSLINAEAVNLIAWNGWVALRQPDRGEAKTFDVTATIGDEYQELILSPQRETESLSQCRTIGG
jgi:hypothetical protein